MIKQLKDIVKIDFSLVGGKALNLAMMNNHGINIPDAFVITSKATTDKAALSGTFLQVPERSEVPLNANEQLVVELYSK